MKTISIRVLWHFLWVYYVFSLQTSPMTRSFLHCFDIFLPHLTIWDIFSKKCAFLFNNLFVICDHTFGLMPLYAISLKHVYVPVAPRSTALTYWFYLYIWEIFATTFQYAYFNRSLSRSFLLNSSSITFFHKETLYPSETVNKKYIRANARVQQCVARFLQKWMMVEIVAAVKLTFDI